MPEKLKLDSGKRSETWEIWISHKEESISFHSIKNFDSVLILDESDMWAYIYRFLENGYRIQ